MFLYFHFSSDFSIESFLHRNVERSKNAKYHNSRGRGRGARMANYRNYDKRRQNVVSTNGLFSDGVGKVQRKNKRKSIRQPDHGASLAVPADDGSETESDVELIGFEGVPEQRMEHYHIDLTDDNDDDDSIVESNAVEQRDVPAASPQASSNGASERDSLQNQSPAAFVEPQLQPGCLPHEMLQAMPRDLLDEMLTTMTTIRQHQTIAQHHMANNIASDPSAERDHTTIPTEPELPEQPNEAPAQRQSIRRLENEYELISIGQEGNSYTGAVCNFCGYLVENSILNRQVLDAHRRICQKLPVELVSTTTQRVTSHDIDTVTSTQPILASIVQCFMCGIQSDRPHFDIDTSFARYSRAPLADIICLSLLPEHNTPGESDQVCSECFTLINQFDSATLAVGSVRYRIHQKLAERQALLNVGHHSAAEAETEIQNGQAIGNIEAQDYEQVPSIDGGAVDSESDENIAA